MQIGDRIRRIREFRKITQKDLGVMIGIPEASASSRLTQYEAGTRVPKNEIATLLAKALECNVAHLQPTSSLPTGESIMMDLFWLEELLSGSMQIFQFQKYSDRDDERVLHASVNDYNYQCYAPPVGIAFDYLLINGFMAEWAVRFKELKAKEITREEYFEWKLNWPKTCDDGGRFEPSYKWRKAE